AHLMLFRWCAADERSVCGTRSLQRIVPKDKIKNRRSPLPLQLRVQEGNPWLILAEWDWPNTNGNATSRRQLSRRENRYPKKSKALRVSLFKSMRRAVCIMISGWRWKAY